MNRVVFHKPIPKSLRNTLPCIIPVLRLRFFARELLRDIAVSAGFCFGRREPGQAGVRQGQEGRSMFCICVALIHGCTRCLQVLQHMAGVRYKEILPVPRIERFQLSID